MTLTYSQGLTTNATFQVYATAPSVTLLTPDFINAQLPSVLVNVVSGQAIKQVFLDIDLNHDGQFTGNELGVASATVGANGSLTNFQLWFSYPITAGYYNMRARAVDSVGNTGLSATLNVPLDFNSGIVGSQPLLQLANGTYPLPLSSPFSQFVADNNNRVLVGVRTTLAVHMNQMLSELVNIGDIVMSSTPSQNLLTGFLPISSISKLATLPYFNSATPSGKPLVYAGPITTQGDAAIGGPQFRATEGVNGAGVKVGVLSDSVNQFGGGIAQSIASGTLPAAGVQVIQDGSSGGTDEGRAMLEIVHTVAPGSSLAFATGEGGPQAFANNIQALANAGAKVINDDLGYADSPFFNDGVISKAVNSVVTNNGVFYDSAAGNDGKQAWQASWQPTQATVGGVSGTFETIAGNSALQTFTLAVGETTNILFQWDSAFLEQGAPLNNMGAYQVKNELDVLVTTANGQRLLQTFNTNTLNTGEAEQIVAFTNDGSFGTNSFSMSFRLANGPAPTFLRWINSTDGLPDINALNEGNSPATYGQRTAINAVSVAAAFWGTPTVPESFTAQGGAMPFFFDNNGNRLTTPEIRNKPQVTGPDGVATSFFGNLSGTGPNAYYQFFGTSAATPHIAGAAALLLQQSPTSTPAQVTTNLETTATDIFTPGYDFTTGFGFIHITPITPTPPGGPGGPGNPGGGSQDIHNLNNTEDTAFNLGTLAKGQVNAQTYTALNVGYTSSNVAEQNWFKLVPAASGTLTVTINTTSGGNLELHLYDMQGNNFTEIANSTSPGRTHSVSVAVEAGTTYWINVHGFQTIPGIPDQGTYDLITSLT